MQMQNLIEHSDNYSKKSGTLQQYYRNEPFLDDNGAITDFPVDENNSALFKFKAKIVGRIGSNGRRDVKIRVPLKYSSNFLRIFKMSLINCEINFILTCSARCFIIDDPIAGREPTLKMTDTRFFFQL